MRWEIAANTILSVAAGFDLGMLLFIFFFFFLIVVKIIPFLIFFDF